MAAATPTKWTAKAMQERLRRHYIPPMPLPGGVYLPEVTMNGGGRADGLYIGFTSTRGHHLVGHEIKVTRSDWLHELSQPWKAEVWASECHAWYVVAPEGIVRTEELPEGWGLMVPNNRTTTRMDIVVKATVHHDRQPSWRALHSIAKRQDTLRAQDITEVRRKTGESIADEVNKRVEEIRERGQHGVDLRPRVRELEQLVDDLAKIMGVESFRRGGSWGNHINVDEFAAAMGDYILAHRNVGQAIKLSKIQLRNARENLQNALAGLDRHMTDNDELPKNRR